MTRANTGLEDQGAVIVLDVFADGSCEPRNRRGGWAFVAYRDATEIASAFGGVADTANNTMELVALLNAIQWIEENATEQAVTLWTDSTYAADGCNRWRHIWKHNGWKRITPNAKMRKRTIADADLWQVIDAQLVRLSFVTVAWCKSHSGLAGNERADKLAAIGRVSRS